MLHQFTRHIRSTTAAAVLASLCVAGQASAGYLPTTSFNEPTAWTVGDANSTYQEWDNFGTSTGNVPDVGLNINPAIATGPTVGAVSPGFVSGSGNFYSFSSDYGITADIYNHGGAVASGWGTHVIVQTATSLNGGVGVIDDTLQIVDLLGAAIAGGDSASVLSHTILFEELVSSSFGDVTLREEAWEFFLPGYSGDFQVQGDMTVHGSFDRIRIDSAIVPEPASLALLTLGGTVIGLRRKV